VSVDEAQRIINTYRNTYYRIPELWRRADDALVAIISGATTQIDVPGLIHATPQGITLPSGLHIQYPGLERVWTASKPQWTYQSKGMTTKVYGGGSVVGILPTDVVHRVGTIGLECGVYLLLDFGFRGGCHFVSPLASSCSVALFPSHRYHLCAQPAGCT